MTPIHRTPPHRNLARPVTALCASLLLPALYGCQGHKIVARVGGETITEEQYVNRLEHVVPQEFQALMQTNTGLTLDAGAVAIVTAIRERAVDIMAKQKNVVPSDATVDTIFKYQLLSNPNLANLIRNKTVDETDMKHNLRVQTEAIGIGTDGAQVDPKELNDAFNAAKNSPNPADKLDISEKYGMRLLRVKDATDGLLVLGRLKASGDFATEARQEGDRGQLDGTEQIFPVADIQRLLPTLYDSLKNLAPGQFVPTPLTLSVPQSNGGQPAGAQNFTVVAQLTKKIPAHQVTLEEVRPELTTRLLTRKYPQWQQHFVQTLNDYLRNKDTLIEIDIDRYQQLIPAFFKTPPEAMSAPAGAPAGAPDASGGMSAPPAGMDTQPPAGAMSAPGGKP